MFCIYYPHSENDGLFGPSYDLGEGFGVEQTNLQINKTHSRPIADRDMVKRHGLLAAEHLPAFTSPLLSRGDEVYDMSADTEAPAKLS